MNRNVISENRNQFPDKNYVQRKRERENKGREGGREGGRKGRVSDLVMPQLMSCC